ncbi:GTP-binding protein [uncultured Thiohalocapsa sp.]|uniref:CobW family GTP-binding protein n=1 Tax=uncultured Thiohalocapsa sp. TaxID=768990 RepID=UPI0025E98A67|nr:GTP-binding protein [uncultured Thiohalocapsa sp.]
MPRSLIPVTLLTGFLGSGKTTVLNHLVRQPELARTLVIINEFGEVGLDHLLMSRVADDTVVEMSSGCLCCTIRGDLVSTLKDAHWRFSRGGERQFDRVVIETTGLADPAPIIHTLMTVDVIARRYRLDGIVTTLDLTNAGDTLDAQPEALKQAAVADCLLLTKADLAEPAAVTALEQRLDRINPAARRLRVHNGVVAPSSLLGLGLFDPTQKTPDVARWLNEEAYRDAADTHADHDHSAPGQHEDDGHRADPGHRDHSGHDGHHDHSGDHHAADHHHHDRNRHDDHIRAFCIVIDPPLADSMLDAWLDLLLSLAGPDMLRVKGILNLRGRPAPVAIHGVQHIFHPPVELPAWPSDDRRSRIVFITRDIPRETIEASLNAFIEVWQGPAEPG